MAEEKDVVSEEQADQTTEQQQAGAISVSGIEDVGTLRKKVTVEVPRELIDSKFDENFGELAKTAQVPGFRIGRAPRQLIEKRFGRDVKEQVRLTLIGQSVEQALQQSELKTIGEPDFDPEKIEMPDEGPMSFSFEVEVRPEFDLPELKGIAITKPSPQVTDKDVADRIEAMRWNQAQLQPAPEGAAVKENDRLKVDLELQLPDKEPAQRSVTLDVHAQSIDGIPFPDLVEQLKGLRVGETKRIEQTIPDDYTDEALRGKQAVLTVTVKEIHQWQLPQVDQQFLSRAGFADRNELESYIRTELESQKGRQVRQAMQDQVRRYLLEKTQFELPQDLANRQSARALIRRVYDLMQLGIPRVLIEKRMDEIRATAHEEVVNDLKIQFIVEKIAELLDIDVSDEEVNGAIAQLAINAGRRPERVREEMIKEGTYESVRAAIKETKVINKLLEDANVTEEKSDNEGK